MATDMKPIFIPKSKRDSVGEQRRQDSVPEQRLAALDIPSQKLSPPTPQEPPNRLGQHDHDRDCHEERRRGHIRCREEGDHERVKDLDRDCHRNRRTGQEQRHRERGRDRKRCREEIGHREREQEDLERERDRAEKLVEREKAKEEEVEAIREQYLGSKKPKKRVIKPSEKFRFSFDWDNTEDTSRGMDALYLNPHRPPQILFGRGFIAGADRRVQKKLADLHWSRKKLEEMKDCDWRMFCGDHNISFRGSRIPPLMRSWAESKLSPRILKAVEEAGYKQPFPIQMAAIPLGLQQRDVIGISQTGSGKTSAFVLPMLSYVTTLPPMATEENKAQGPYAAVLAPTRELAQQIEAETMKFACHLGIKVVSLVGGQPIEQQGARLMQGCEIVIATPGRMLDCLERRYAVLNQCNYVVLDEADRMIDMGFVEQVVGVLDAMPSSNLKPENEDAELDEKKVYRTTYMFSATMTWAAERLARKYMRKPIVVTVGTVGEPTEYITQHVIMMKESEKLPRLQKLLDELGEKRAIVFCNRQISVDARAKDLEKLGYNVRALHGGMPQRQRDISLEWFRKKRFNVLVSTNVTGRGIDIPDVAHVINYDMPGDIAGYIHRIGRTGRAGKTGVATTFLTLQDSEVFYDLKQVLAKSRSPVPSELARIPDRLPRRNGTFLFL